MIDESSRREFLKFMGVTIGAGGAALSGCAENKSKKPGPLAPAADPIPEITFSTLKSSTIDDLQLADGFKYDMMIKWQDKINSSGDRFGYNNDYIATLPMRHGKENEAMMWVNHEYTDDVYDVSTGSKVRGPYTEEQVIEQMKDLGGSLVKIQRDNDGRWKVADSRFNRRVDALTKIDIISDRPIQGSTVALGTLANCSGGVTPWGTFLSAEENYKYNHGEAIMEDKVRKVVRAPKTGWEKYNCPPEHYGWIVEVDPFTGYSKKLTGIGRYAHECATVRKASNDVCVVYSGDDANDRCLYKFIADEPGSLDFGTLYVADVENGKWIPVVYDQHEILQKHFNDQTDVLTYCRKSAELVGGSKLDRPEDIVICPKTDAVYVTLTNNIRKGNYHGSILKLEEKNNDPFSLEFTATTFLKGGLDTGFSAPDNLAFDKHGNLWMTSDISGSAIEKGEYKGFGNNALFYIPMSGDDAGKVFKIAIAPVQAEFTGPCFSPDGKSLFVSVQHPGEKSKSRDKLKSTWPDRDIPRPAVVEIHGPAMDALLANETEK